MEAIFRSPVTAAQIGSYFVGQYYQILQQKPNLAHQFYTESSKMLLIDGDISRTAKAVMEIHSLILTLNLTGIEIKTINSLDSLEEGILVLVSGIVQTKDYNARRKFVQTFFLAPQDKGYFVLNDIFHFLDEEDMYQHPPAISANGNYESNLVAVNTVPEPENDVDLDVPEYAPEYAPEYTLEEIQSREYVHPVDTEENDTVDMYRILEPQQVSESDDRVDETPGEESIALFPGVVNMPQDPPAPVEEPVEEYPNQIYAEPIKQTHSEPVKHTYASILRLAKGKPSNSISQTFSSNKTILVDSDWNQAPQSAPQQNYPQPSSGPQKSNSEAVGDVSLFQDEGEERSVYVGNLPSSVTASDLEHEFKNFGRIKPDGVAVRSRKETGGYYAFVEFEDASGVQNALKASPILLNGRQIYVEERKPNSSLSRGGRRGRGRGAGYQSEASRGRFGAQSYGRASVQDDGEWELSGRTRGSGSHRRVPPQERGILGSQAPRNNQNTWEATP